LLKAKVKVVLKSGILDPQGKAVMHAIKDLGYQNITDVRIGKFIELEMKDTRSEKIRQELDEICKKLLSNPIIENYQIEIEE
jgi:phosphoribosylformylglycinamidine synthase PurS subunit